MEEAAPVCAQTWWEATLLIVAILYVFVGLSQVCDAYLVRSLEMIVKKLNISDDVAGASFLALGVAMPEVAINCLAVFRSSASLGMSALLGSGMWAFTVIPGLCALFSPKGMALADAATIRDIAAYAISLFLLMFFVWDSTLDLWESGTLFVLYLVYIVGLFLVWPAFFPHNDKETAPLLGGEEDGRGHGTYHSSLLEDENTPRNNNSKKQQPDLTKGDDGGEGQQEEDEQHQTGAWGKVVAAWDKVWSVLVLPYTLLYRYTIPNCDEETGGNEWYFPLTFIASLIYVVVLSFIVVVCTEMASCSLNVPHVLLGMTLVAFGAQVPDTFSSVAVARHGHGAMAFSSAIGSQVCGILLGVGLPYFIANKSSTTVVLNQAHINILLVTLCTLVLCFIVVLLIARLGHPKAVLSHFSGGVLIAVYIVGLSFAGSMVANIAW